MSTFRGRGKLKDYKTQCKKTLREIASVNVLVQHEAWIKNYKFSKFSWKLKIFVAKFNQ